MGMSERIGVLVSIGIWRPDCFSLISVLRGASVMSDGSERAIERPGLLP